MKWYDSGPLWFLGCTLCGLPVYFIHRLVPGWMSLGMVLAFSAAAAVYSARDFKRKLPDCNSKIGYAIIFLIIALAYAMSKIAL